MTLLELKEEIVKKTLISDVVDKNGQCDIYIVPEEENEDFDYEEDALYVLESYVTDLSEGKFLILDLHTDEKTITDAKGVVAYYLGWSDAMCDYMFSADQKEKHELYKKSYNETMLSLSSPNDSEKDMNKKISMN
jgi:hypothetical protein